MATIDKIIQFAESSFFDNEAEIENYNKWCEYIKPLFKENFNLDYRPEYEQFYNQHKLQFLQEEREKFNLNINN